MSYDNVVTLPIDDLTPYENNPRNNLQAVDAVADSIREFGFRVPIVVDRNKVIIAGHTRYLASKQLNLKEVPCIIASDLTDAQVRAFRLADNKVGEIAGWDFDMLERELQELASTDIDMSEFGFVDSSDLDVDGFFTESEKAVTKEPKRIQCPCCGEWFEH